LNGRDFAAAAGISNEGELRVGMGSRFSTVGEYGQAAGARVTVEVGGADAGQRGMLAVGGQATLDGTLAVEFVGGFVPVVDATFDVVSYAQRAGQFAQILVEPAGVVVEADYQADSLVLTVTEVPAAPSPNVQFAMAAAASITTRQSSRATARAQVFDRLGRTDQAHRATPQAADRRTIRRESFGQHDSPLRRLRAAAIDRAIVDNVMDPVGRRETINARRSHRSAG